MNTETADIEFTNRNYKQELKSIFGNCIPMYTSPGLEVITFPEEMTFKGNTGEFDLKLFIPSEKDIFDISKEYYKKNKNDLLKKYKAKHIAIIGKKVVDSDKEFSKLIKRVYKKYGYKNIFMPYVDKKEKIAIIPSPISNGL